MPPSGGTPRPIPDADSADGMGARWPHLLADGKTVLYARGPAAAFLSRSRIAITTISGGRSTILDLPGTSPLGVIDGQLIYASTSGALFSVPVDISGRRGAGAPVQVLSAVGFNASSAIAKASLSATGSLTYQPRTTTSHLVLVSPGGASRLLLKDAKGFSNPRFSPDGKLVAVGVTSESGTDVWILDVAAGTLGRLTSAGATNGYPEWSPDGRRVVFRSDRGTSSSLWWQPVDGSGAAELLLRSGTDDVWEGMVSPDGKWLLYRTGSVGAADIWYRQRSGDTASHPVATTPASEWAARLSPDGHWVAYSSNESGTTQVYVRPFPGPGGRVQVSVEGGETPVWSRDGHHLYYAYGQQLVDASVTTSAPFAVTTRQLLFNSDYLFGTRSHSNYDVTQDGKQFLFLKPVGSDAQVLVIHDWKYELRANRAATGRAR